MNTAVKVARQRLSVLDLAEKLGCVSEDVSAAGYVTQARAYLGPDDYDDDACQESIGENPDAAFGWLAAPRG